MENEVVVPETQNTPEVTTPKVEEITISQAELEDLKHKAEVSSQNFERAKKAEGRVKELENNNVTLEVGGSGEEDAVKLKDEIRDIKSKLARAEVIENHPELKESWPEFEKFREDEDNKGMNLKTAAKAFLIEKGLINPQRKGLEKPTGGSKTPPTTGMTVDEVKQLRETNYRKYTDMLKKGQIKI